MKFIFRLGKGAFAQTIPSISGSLITTEVTSIQTVSTSTLDGQLTTSTNIIVSTRLRQTDKRLLRKIHTVKNTIPIQEKSRNKNY